MPSELPLHHLTCDLIERNGDAFAAFRLVGVNPRGVALYIHLAPPVQGFSGVLAGPRKTVYHFLVDNGFGAQANSADALLRAYTLEVNWRTRKGGAGTINPANWDSGKGRSAFDPSTRLELNDARHKLTIPIQANSTLWHRILSS